MCEISWYLSLFILGVIIILSLLLLEENGGASVIRVNEGGCTVGW